MSKKQRPARTKRPAERLVITDEPAEKLLWTLFGRAFMRSECKIERSIRNGWRVPQPQRALIARRPRGRSAHLWIELLLTRFTKTGVFPLKWGEYERRTLLEDIIRGVRQPDGTLTVSLQEIEQAGYRNFLFRLRL